MGFPIIDTSLKRKPAFHPSCVGFCEGKTIMRQSRKKSLQKPKKRVKLFSALKGIWKRIKTAIRPFLRPQMIISCALPFCVITLPAYVLPIIGLIFHNAALTAIGTAWLGIIHLPICHESIIIVPVGLFIHGKLFPKDKITKYRLLRLYAQAKKDWQAVKNKFNRRNKNGK